MFFQVSQVTSVHENDEVSIILLFYFDQFPVVS